jgi:peptidoglycan/xylan/chitin deacetylase (PgdA/CDA1 family)
VSLRTLKTVAAAGDRLRPPSAGVVVLIYHRVGARADIEIDLPEADFDRQMAYLAGSGRAVTLDDAVDLLAGGSPPDGDGRPEHPVVVTFDDGTSDLAEVALPVLDRHRVPATVYLATRFVDEGLAWPAGGEPLSWSAAREMRDSGLVTFGSHTHSHLLLDRLPAGEAADELDRSKGLIEDELQVAAEHFAYPKAVAPSPAVEGLVRDRFRTAALGGNRPNVAGATDRHRLARSAVQVSDGWTFFVRKLAGGMALEDSARRALNRLRYRRSAG